METASQKRATIDSSTAEHAKSVLTFTSVQSFQILPKKTSIHYWQTTLEVVGPSNSNNVLLSVEKGSSWALSTCQIRWSLRGQAPLVTDKTNSLLPLQSSNRCHSAWTVPS